MKFTCSRSALAAAFQVVSGVIPSRTPREILKNTRLEVRPGEITLSGTDGDGIGIRYGVPNVETNSAGEVLLPTARIISILRELTDEVLDIEINSNSANIKSGFSEFNLSVEEAADFPPIAAFEDDSYFVVAADTLRKMTKRTLFATDTESSRYALGGVLLQAAADSITLAATDGRRLAVMSGSCTQVGTEPSQNSQPVIPQKAMNLIERSLGDASGEVHIAVHANDVAVRVGTATIISQLVQGRFPDYQKVIPKEIQHTVDLVTSPFYSAIRQAQVVTSEESRGVDFEFTEGQLCLSSKAADVGQSKIAMPISFAGPKLVLRFDPRYVADFLRVLDGTMALRFDLVNEQSPGVLRTDDGYTYVIMPLARE